MYYESGGITISLRPRIPIDLPQSKGNQGRTIRYRPRKLVFTQEFETKQDAIKREKQLKTA